MNKATSRPWEIIVDNDSPYGNIWSPCRETVIATMTGNGQGLLEIKANAELIIRAVNTFDQAREALEYYAKTAIGARAVEVLEKIAAMEVTHEPK